MLNCTKSFKFSIRSVTQFFCKPENATVLFIERSFMFKRQNTDTYIPASRRLDSRTEASIAMISSLRSNDDVTKDDIIIIVK